MRKSLFRVKRYSHPKYKFLVRARIEGKWRRRYFITEQEAIAFADEQNAQAPKTDPAARSPQKAAIPRPAVRGAAAARSPSMTDFTKLMSPTYLGPQIERYLGDSWCMHLPFAYDLMRELAPKVFVELGVKEGESYFGFCQSAAENKINVRCYGVDSWRGDVQTGTLDPEIERQVAEYNWRYSSFSELKPMLFADALPDFPDGSIDLLHIDGTHTYTDVKNDFESWLPKLSRSGVVLFHDVMIRDRAFGVWKLWEEIAKERESFLFEFGFGLGVWRRHALSTSDSPFLHGLLTAKDSQRRDINEFYANAASALALWQTLRKQPETPPEVVHLQRHVDEKIKHIELLQCENEEKTKQLTHFKAEAEDKATHVASLLREVEEKTQQVFHFKKEAEDKAAHVILLQRENEEKTKQVLHLKNEAQDNSNRVAQLQKDLAAGVEQLAQLQAETKRGAQELNRLQAQIDRQAESRRTASDAAGNERWDTLMLHKALLSQSHSAEAASTAALEQRVELDLLQSELQHLRETATKLLTDLNQSKENASRLEGAEKQLAKYRRHLGRLDDLTNRKLILPFGRRHRRVREIITSAAQI